MMLTLKELQTEAYATAREKGWHDRPLCKGTHLNRAPFDLSPAPIEPDHDRILAKHALIHSEITEAVQALDDDERKMAIVDDKPEGFVVEIADAIIRVCDTTAALGIAFNSIYEGADWTQRASSMRMAIEIQAVDGHEQHVAVVLWCERARQHVDLATEAVRVDDWVRYGEQCTHVVMTLASVCAGLSLDLSEALRVKMAYNKTRPHRHGGKSA